MRIVILVHSLRRGGAEKIALETALGLKSLGHSIHIISWTNFNEYTEKKYKSLSIQSLIDFNEYNYLKSIPKSAFLLRKLLKKIKPDSAVMHSPTIPILIFFSFFKIPLVHVLHGHSNFIKKWTFKGFFERFLDIFLSRFLNIRYVVVTGSIIPFASLHYRLRNKFFTIITNAIDLEYYKFKLKTPRRQARILMVGTLFRLKGQKFAILAIKELLKKMPHTRLVFAGNGPDYQFLKNFSAHNLPSNKISFLGVQKNIYHLLINSDIFWQLSSSEGMSLAVLEAMAVGVPVVSFNVPGIREVIQNNKSGYLATYGDFRDVAHLTYKLLNNKSLYKQFAINARLDSEKLCSFDRMINSYNLYLENLD